MSEPETLPPPGQDTQYVWAMHITHKHGAVMAVYRTKAECLDDCASWLDEDDPFGVDDDRDDLLAHLAQEYDVHVTIERLPNPWLREKD